MSWNTWIWIAAVAACPACAVDDDRPQTLAYITETILAPNCATAECHSAMKNEYGYAFDTVDNAQASMTGERPNTRALIDTMCPPYPQHCDLARGSYLLTVLSGVDSKGNRMPFDEPLPNADIVLIQHWIDNGAAGYVPPGDAGIGN